MCGSARHREPVGTARQGASANATVPESAGSESANELRCVGSGQLVGTEIPQRFLGQLARVPRIEWLSPQDRQLDQIGALDSLSNHQLREARQYSTVGEREHRQPGKEREE